MSPAIGRTLTRITLGFALIATSYAGLTAQRGGGRTPEAPNADNKFYEAIRSDDLPALRALIAERGANARGTSGLSPLTMATAFGSLEAVKLLLDAGAEATPAVSGALTPLHVGWRDMTTARLLLDHGAKADVKTSRGRTPLLLAAGGNGRTDVLSLLIEKGADVNAADTTGVTPLIAAASAGNTAAAKLLLGHGADPNIVARDAGVATALMGAATNSDVELTRLLLAQKPDVAAVSVSGQGRAKNGVITFGHVTALHLAAAGRSPEVVRMLLDAGAPIDALDMRGMTPLMFAIAVDGPDPRIVQLLVERGASLSIAMPNGETAVDWAHKFNDPAVLKAMHLTPASRAAAPVASHPAASSRQAVERNLPLLRTGSARMLTDGGCIACHAQPMLTMTLATAKSRGWAVEVDDAALTQVKQHINGALQGMLQFYAAGGAPQAELYDVMAMNAAGVPANVSTDALVYYLVSTQQPEGFWHRPASPNRAPIQDGDLSRTAQAVLALAMYPTPARKTDVSASVGRAADWLSRQTPISTEERVMQLLALQSAGRPPAPNDARIKALLAQQRPDGGWPQTPHLASDAYGTGQALYALSQLEVPTTNAAVQKGIAFLLRTQAEDGTWHVATRAMPIQPYFESGFPYGREQWISYSATAWADMALILNDTASRTAPTNGR
jgi:ankyrin repeat protein